MDQETVGKVADATKAVAETGGKAIEAASGFGRIIKGPVEDLVGILHDQIRFWRAERMLSLQDKAQVIMSQRQIAAPTRDLPFNFAMPLLSQASLEEDDDLQGTWAHLLVNAGDASTPMELRTAYVDILKSMSAFDVRNLAILAELSLKFPDKGYGEAIPTDCLPGGGVNHTGPGGMPAPISPELGISLNNLSRLGCIIPASGWGGISLYHMVTVTHLGMALYRACS